MVEKKFFTSESLTIFVDLIKNYVTTIVSALVGDTPVSEQISAAIEIVTPDDIDAICGVILEDNVNNILQYGSALYLKRNINVLQNGSELNIL